MEKYFVVVKSASRRKGFDTKESKSIRYQPYNAPECRPLRPKEKINLLLEQLPDFETEPSPANLTKLLLSTLPDESNPLTHSDLVDRSDHVISTSTGHQVAEARISRRTEYFEARAQKLAQQREQGRSESQILRNTRIYIDGYLSGTTDIEMKRIVTEAGGTVLMSASGATHILSSQCLNGSKTHKVLTSKSRTQVQVVKPEWVLDSIQSGRRLPERTYKLIKSNSTKTLHDMWHR
ncbi:uncharacterized protein BT62DRAFT_963888 [Guyanagaster necrorhizus]|uniref:BRCT domain-containing protein n=1 Tax=Guyanagaster necrorhizus TaxID=856835 RepID=A0A9P7VY44_9AGAR|nr:uncharacterized protein BT62DRAFT_963888 [Guyanagaster necrorhizus MCA 3950]KAG7449057.1 hypothetical protein BT62DRAFT_963888 [Guyanagaster necrorhizus MCA 3950]